MHAHNSKGKRVLVDWDGFSGGVPAGTRLAFAMTREVLGYVDTAAANIHRSRAWLLLATIVGEEIDPDAPLYVEANLFERSSTFYGPLTFEYGEDLGLTITATQDLCAMPEGEVMTVVVEIAAETGN
jgi:hypothetical protein